jgi:hypothetical protein
VVRRASLGNRRRKQEAPQAWTPERVYKLRCGGSLYISVIRSWAWRLPTGERVVARFDGAIRRESVYVGRRLVSRRNAGELADGHLVPTRGGADGPFRGGPQVRVVFDPGGDARLLIDGDLVPPEPVAAPSEHSSRGVLAAVFVCIVALVGLMIVHRRGMRHRRAERSSDTPAPTVVPTTLASASLQEIATPNHILTVRYPPDFRAETRSQAGNEHGFVHLTRGDLGETIDFVTDLKPDSTDMWMLDRAIRTAEERRWPEEGLKVVDEDRKEEEWHGHRCAAVVRTIARRNGRRLRSWSCTFLAGGHGYRFITYVPEEHAEDEAYLRTVIDAATL